MNQAIKNRVRSVVVIGLAVLLLGGIDAGAAPRRRGQPMPDLTKGGTKDDKHDWNLGPTGARGWIWGRNLETTDTRQILVTKVDKGSPADGVLAVGDVILGAGGGKFTRDARISFGRAVTEAEKADNKGILKLLRWRAGAETEVQIKLRVMGSYSDTSPYNCAKSRKIIEAGCRQIAKGGRLSGGIPAKINALALLATGNKKYLPMVRAFAHEVGRANLKLKLHGGSGMKAWPWGYSNLFLTEYYLATGDKYVLPAIREYTVNIANGQSGVGSWGHGMAWPDVNGGRLHGPLGGYGALNQAGLICHMSMILAQKCGVRDKAVRQAIDRGNRFFGFYINKGAIPYGDHRPGWQVHDDNGKNSIAAVLFDFQGHQAGARFFSRMTVASYGERERGHTGNYFSFLWGPLGANRAGSAAAAAFLKEQRWFYDMGRRWDGSFPYQGGAGMGGGEHQYGRWDCTGAYLLTYLLPFKRLYITGKGVSTDNALTGAELAQVVEAGRGFLSRDMGVEPYRAKSEGQLLALLGSWSPAVRHRAGVALAGKNTNVVGKLIARLNSSDLTTRYGACGALGLQKARAAAAVPALTKLLNHKDVWLRIQASYALSGIGSPARKAVPEMLKLAVRSDENDPREFTQRYLCFTLFYPGGALRMKGLIARDLSGVDRRLLYPAVRRLLLNDDGRARGTISSIYKQLTYEEIKPLLPAIHESIVTPAPSGVMFASGIRLRGLELLAKYRIKEGMSLCLKIMDIEKWGKRNRINGCLKILGTYGGSAKPVLPEIRKMEQRLKAHREARGMTDQLALIRKTIEDIEAAKDGPKLRSIRD